MCFPQCYIQVSCFQPCLNISPSTTGKFPQKFPGSSLRKYSSCEMANYLVFCPFFFLIQTTLSCSHIAYFTSLPFVATLNWQRTTLPSSYSHTKLLYSRCWPKNKGVFFPPHFKHCVFEHTSAVSQWPGSSSSTTEGNHRLQTISIHSQSPDFTWKCFHAMARGNWYLESKVYSTILPFLSLSRPSEGDCHFHGVTEQETIRTGMLFHENLVCFWWYKRKSSPIHLPEKSALNSCEFLWSW